MKTEWRIFAGIAAFMVVLSGIYAGWSSSTLDHVEWIGTIALLLCAFLTGLVGWYFWVISRRIEPRPEDRPEAEIAEGAGEIGFFSPGSYFPFGLAFAICVGGIGVAFWMWWLIITGIISVILMVSGMLFEYYTGTRRTATE